MIRNRKTHAGNVKQQYTIIREGEFECMTTVTEKCTSNGNEPMKFNGFFFHSHEIR